MLSYIKGEGDVSNVMRSRWRIGWCLAISLLLELTAFCIAYVHNPKYEIFVFYKIEMLLWWLSVAALLAVPVFFVSSFAAACRVAESLRSGKVMAVVRLGVFLICIGLFGLRIGLGGYRLSHTKVDKTYDIQNRISWATFTAGFWSQFFDEYVRKSGGIPPAQISDLLVGTNYSPRIISIYPITDIPLNSGDSVTPAIATRFAAAFTSDCDFVYVAPGVNISTSLNASADSVVLFYTKGTCIPGKVLVVYLSKRTQIVSTSELPQILEASDRCFGDARR